MHTHVPTVIRHVSKTAGRISISFLSVLIILFLFAPRSFAITIVTSTGNSGPGTLRQALLDAPSGGVIQISVTGTIILASELVLAKDVQINGPGARRLNIVTTDTGQVFRMDSTFVGLSGLMIGGPGQGQVQAIGFLMNGGNATLTDCVISGNHGSGVRIESAAGLTMNRCTISGNANAPFVGGASGGGLFTRGTVALTNCSIVGNTLFSAGFFSSAGGGIYCEAGNVAMTNCTVSGNLANGQLPGSGGGICRAGGAVRLSNTIVSNNTTAFGGSPDLSGEFLTFGYNLIQRGDGSTGLSNGVNHDQVGTIATPREPLLGSLRDNGGPVDTVSIASNSPAVDAANMVIAPVRDQRNYVRSGLVDIGAFEVGGTTPHTLANISTRLPIQTGDNVLIGGFIITGIDPKSVLIRAIGPSTNLPGSLANPVLELHDGTGALLASNDDWMDAPNKQAIINTTIPPTNDLESAILMTLAPGNYTAIVHGANATTGIGLVEAYDLDRTTGARLANISTRGFVQTGNNVLIGGFIVLGPDQQRVVLRGIGPSLNLPGKLADPTLELHGGNGALLFSNDNWRTTQESEIVATGVPPSNDSESAIVATLDPGNYTAILSGKNGTTGVAVVEVYALD